jgi:hypothetical protein
MAFEEAALAFYGELPGSDDWLDFCLRRLFALDRDLADADGSWQQGPHLRPSRTS